MARTVRMVVAGLLPTAMFVAAAPEASAQFAPFDRLPSDVFEAESPTARVGGAPGELVVQPSACPTRPLAEARRRVVDLAVQEWGFFGFSIRDETIGQVPGAPSGGAGAPNAPRFLRGGFWRPSAEEAARVATSIAGYWAATPQAATMIARMNANSGGRSDPWSAAFVSWVMCEAGLGQAGRFHRAIAHHVYIDQAIRARAGSAPQAAFVAYDVGEVPVVPGDLLCAGRRPVYRSIAERRRQMGVGARTHCDVVVKVDEAERRILAIGGNVRRSVALKILPATRGPSGHLRPATVDATRPVFAHLSMRAEPIDAHALDSSPTVRALACGEDAALPAPVRTAIPAGMLRTVC